MQTSAHQCPWPHQIRGVETGHMDPDPWDWLQRLKAPGRTLAFQRQSLLVTGGASGFGKKLCVLAAELGAEVATIDISDSIATKFNSHGITGIACNIAD